VEEALLSPVISCRGVLRLPSGGQLGYTGSFINFVSDVNVVSQQLPRAPHNIGLIIYQAKGAKDTVKLLEVRKAAVEAHLRFFCRHHYYFINGIPNPNAWGDAAYTVKPILFSERDQGRLDQLPACGVPAGLDIRPIDNDDTGDHAADLQNESIPTDGADSTKVATPRPVAVWSKLLLQWLRSNCGAAALFRAALRLSTPLSLTLLVPPGAQRLR